MCIRDSTLHRIVAKVIEQEVFPSVVLKARAKETSFRKKKVSVDADADIDNDDVIAPPPTTVSPPTDNSAPPTTLPVENNVNSQPHDNQVINHII